MPSRRGIFSSTGATVKVKAVAPVAIPAITRRLTPKVDLVFDGKRWPVVFTHDALLEIEEVGNINILADGANLYRPSANLLRACLFVALRRAGADCSLETAGRILGTRLLFDAHASLLEAWRAAMPVPESDVDPAQVTAPDKPRGWPDIWADNRYSLGLTDEEWLGMTPRMVQLLAHERLEEMRQNELMLGRVAAAAANFGGSAPKKPLRDEDFMLHPWPKKKLAKTEVTGEYLMQLFKTFKPEGKTIQ